MKYPLLRDAYRIPVGNPEGHKPLGSWGRICGLKFSNFLE
jgi:hypothetical protein